MRLVPQLQEPDLGARMGHAMQHAFALGHQRVAIVGTDVPDLTAGIVRRALLALDTHQARARVSALWWQVGAASLSAGCPCICLSVLCLTPPPFRLHAGRVWAGRGWGLLPTGIERAPPRPISSKTASAGLCHASLVVGSNGTLMLPERSSCLPTFMPSC